MEKISALIISRRDHTLFFFPLFSSPCLSLVLYHLPSTFHLPPQHFNSSSRVSNVLSSLALFPLPSLPFLHHVSLNSHVPYALFQCPHLSFLFPIHLLPIPFKRSYFPFFYSHLFFPPLMLCISSQRC